MLSDNFISGGLKCCWLLQQCGKNHTIYSVEDRAIRSNVGMKKLKVNYSPLNTPLCSECCKENTVINGKSSAFELREKFNLFRFVFNPVASIYAIKLLSLIQRNFQNFTPLFLWIRKTLIDLESCPHPKRWQPYSAIFSPKSKEQKT